MGTNKKENVSVIEKAKGLNFNKIFAILAVFIVIIWLYVMLEKGDNVKQPETIKLENIFIDVDGDGKVDFVPYIEYVPNNPQSSQTDFP